MLDRTKLLKEVQNRSQELFVDYSHEQDLAWQLWNSIIHDPLLIYKVRAATTHYAIPAWCEPLDTVVPINPELTEYGVCAVDGSQIYPDRHQGVRCYLINIGSVTIKYGAEKNVSLHSTPYLFTSEDDDEPVMPDTVNCRRDEYEFAQAVTNSLDFQQKYGKSRFVLLFDGSLIFWHLESKDQAFKQQFLQSYFSSLMTLFHAQVVTASYISLPKNREVSHLLRLALCGYNTQECEALVQLDHVIDTTIMRLLLKPYSRSAIFKHTGSIADMYPDELKPHFFYLHVGNEIARIEIPAWIAQEQELVNALSAVILNQCSKGNGYPVVLAEAHEQAVIKGPDRDFFYHIIAKIGVIKKQRIIVSQKSLKKRGIGI